MATVSKQQPAAEYTLTLSQEEADAVYSALANVGGSPSRSPRGLIDNVLDAFVNRGVRREHETAGSVYFEDDRPPGVRGV